MEEDNTMQLGREVHLPEGLEPPVLLFFVSTFCSKCLYNRQILQKFINHKLILEVNISEDTLIMSTIRPRMVPTVVMIDDESRIIFYEEGVLHDKTVKSLQLLLSRYLD